MDLLDPIRSVFEDATLWAKIYKYTSAFLMKLIVWKEQINKWNYFGES